MKGFDSQPTRGPTVRTVILGRGRPAVTDRRIKLLGAFIALAIGSPAAHASEVVDGHFKKAWECAEAVVDGVEDLAVTGAKALKFIASPNGAECVVRLGSPPTLAPIGVVLALTNTGVLSHNCTTELFNTAAKPIAGLLSEGLGALGILNDEQNNWLADIAAGNALGTALQEIPGLTSVTGSLTCGCDLYDAGLSVETIKRVLNTADNLGDKCPIGWKETKAVAKVVGKAARVAATEVVLQISNLGDEIAGQSKNMPNTAYFDQYWAPNIEHFAAVEFKSPGTWHGQEKWRELWGPCVGYFDTHTLSEKNARNVCDDMRSGNSHPNYFAGKGFSQRMFRRVFEFDVTGEVEQARKQAYIDNADMEITVQGTKDPMAADRNRDYHDANFPAELPKFIRAAVDAVFGIPTKEKKHEGLVVANSAPPTTWPADTVGAHAFDFYDQVKGDQGNHRADAAKAVQLAMQDLDVTAQVRAGAEKQTLAFYEREDFIDVGSGTESDQDKVNAMVEQCPTDTCRDSVGLGYRTCSIAAEEYRAANAAAIDNLSYTGQRERDEFQSRVNACMAQAKQTLRDARYHVAGETPTTGNALPPIATGADRYKPGRASGGRRATDGEDATAGRNTPETPTTRDPFGGVLRDRLPVSRKDDTAPAAEVSPADARVSPESLRRRLRTRAIPAAVVDAGQASEDSDDESERRHDDLPADAVIGESAGETAAADDLPGCASSRSRGQWICEDSEAHDRCLAAIQRGAARGCALETR